MLSFYFVLIIIANLIFYSFNIWINKITLKEVLKYKEQQFKKFTYVNSVADLSSFFESAIFTKDSYN